MTETSAADVDTPGVKQIRVAPVSGPCYWVEFEEPQDPAALTAATAVVLHSIRDAVVQVVSEINTHIAVIPLNEVDDPGNSYKLLTTLHTLFRPRLAYTGVLAATHHRAGVEVVVAVYNDQDTSPNAHDERVRRLTSIPGIFTLEREEGCYVLMCQRDQFTSYIPQIHEVLEELGVALTDVEHPRGLMAYFRSAR